MDQFYYNSVLYDRRVGHNKACYTIRDGQISVFQNYTRQGLRGLFMGCNSVLHMGLCNWQSIILIIMSAIIAVLLRIN